MKLVPYAPGVGSLMYAMVARRPDIAHAIGVINKFIHNPSRSHWNAVKHVFRYLVGTKELGILFSLKDISGENRQPDIFLNLTMERSRGN